MNFMTFLLLTPYKKMKVTSLTDFKIKKKYTKKETRDHSLM